MEQDLTLRKALAEDRLADFVRQEEDRGVELVKGSEFERALALLITKLWTKAGQGRDRLRTLKSLMPRRSQRTARKKSVT
jgi:hypothetical protein